jgi:hypothetical protein
MTAVLQTGDESALREDDEKLILVKGFISKGYSRFLLCRTGGF